MYSDDMRNFFFFSSRRRHTRWPRDWSSDVCSSDLAWDADADQVSIQLPKPLSGDPIIIRDDGTGMTVEELRRHYLTIARDRRSARGERTVGKNRQVKGRKGIGKFAGFMAASVMTLETRTRGKNPAN